MTLKNGRSLILDNAFAPEKTVGQILALQKKTPFFFVQIVCDAPNEILLNRFIKRSEQRHPGHGDVVALPRLKNSLAQNQSPILSVEGAIIEVETADFANVEYLAVLKKIEQIMENADGNERDEL